MATNAEAKKVVPCPLGICHEGRWCPHAGRAAMAAVGDGVPETRVAPITVEDASEWSVWPVDPPGILPRRRSVEEGPALWCQGPSNDTEGTFKILSDWKNVLLLCTGDFSDKNQQPVRRYWVPDGAPSLRTGCTITLR